jgi:membrane protease YdiL (CAAX protease family)
LSTFGLGLLAMLAGQAAALTALTWWYDTGIAQLPDFSGDGVAVSLIILISTPIQVGLLWLMARQLGGDPAAFIAVGNTVSWLAGEHIVTAFQSDIYRTAARAGWLPVLWLVVVIVTPIGEEILFRGFLFRGWHRSPRDAWAVIVATALLFAAVHVQYDLFVIVQILVFGLLLGWFRWATGSTVLCILLHALVNFEGMLETALSAPR